MRHKLRLLNLILIVVFIFSFTFAGCCFSSGSSDTEEKIKLTTEEVTSNYIDVKYIVIGLNSIDIKYQDGSTRTFPTNPEVSVTYSNSQGGTEQISKINLKKDVHSLGLSEISNPDRWSGEIIAHYENFPISEFLYISAQNQSAGNIIVIILVDGIVWKNSLAKGEYSIATASGIYGE